MRKVTFNDLFGQSEYTSKSLNVPSNVCINKHQRDYGSKKFIKP